MRFELFEEFSTGKNYRVILGIHSRDPEKIEKIRGWIDLKFNTEILVPDKNGFDLHSYSAQLFISPLTISCDNAGKLKDNLVTEIKRYTDYDKTIKYECEIVNLKTLSFGKPGDSYPHRFLSNTIGREILAFLDLKNYADRDEHQIEALKKLYPDGIHAIRGKLAGKKFDF